MFIKPALVHHLLVNIDNEETFLRELLNNLEKMFHRYYGHSDVKILNYKIVCYYSGNMSDENRSVVFI